MASLSRPITLRALLIFFLASFFYLYEFVLQVSPSVISADLRQAFDIDLALYGLCMSGFFYAYAPMQIPGGILYDYYGPRKLLTIMVVFCAVGAGLFAIATSPYQLALGRICMGIGAATSFVGILILIARWFSPYHFAVLAGTAQLMGSLGAIGGKRPFAYMVTEYDWRSAYMLMFWIGLVAAVLIWCVVRDKPDDVSDEDVKPSTNVWSCLKQVLAQKFTWAVGAYAFLVWGPITVFPILYGVIYLEHVFELSHSSAAWLCSFIWIGVAIGSPLIGYISDSIGSRKTPLMVASGLGFVSTLMICLLPNMSHWLIGFFLFLFGLAASGQSLSFAVIRDLQKTTLFGTATGFNNMAVVLGGMTLQPLFGFLLRWFAQEQPSSGFALAYSTDAFRMIMLIMPLCYLLAMLVNKFFIQETHCQTMYSKGD